jgi:hypothetical protein
MYLSQFFTTLHTHVVCLGSLISPTKPYKRPAYTYSIWKSQKAT